jgi:hypothetical protein
MGSNSEIDPPTLGYASPGASKEQRRRLFRFRLSLAGQLLVGGVITCVLWLLVLWLILGLAGQE